MSWHEDQNAVKRLKRGKGQGSKSRVTISDQISLRVSTSRKKIGDGPWPSWRLLEKKKSWCTGGRIPTSSKVGTGEKKRRSPSCLEDGGARNPLGPSK